MAKKKLVNSQISTFLTYLMYKDECEFVAESVFEFKNLPENNLIDIDIVNNTLLYAGHCVFFYDEVLDKFLCLPFTSVNTFDINKNPKSVTVRGENGYTRNLHEGEFVIIWDNSKKISIVKYVRQYAERLAYIQKAIDINCNQQKTPRIWKTIPEKVESVKAMLNEIDGNVDNVVGYEDLLNEGIECVLQPAPFVADKLQIQKEKLWNEFLRFIGVSNVNFEKKERNIRDEVQLSQGGTIANRFNRFSPRKKAIDDINKKWGLNLEVGFYDGVPSTEKEPIESEVDENV